MERGRSIVQRPMKAEHWPAKHDFSSLHASFVALPQVKHQHWTALNKRRRLEWCTSMLQWLGEAKRPHSRTSHAKPASNAAKGGFVA